MSGSAIPASNIVNVSPSVLNAGGIAQDLNGLLITTDNHVPIGKVYSFSSLTAVQAFFGITSAVSALAKSYFTADLNNTKRPGALLVASYYMNQWLPAWLYGAQINITLAQLQATTPGSWFALPMDGTSHGSAALNISLSTATSFSMAAMMIGAALGYSTGNLVGYPTVTPSATATKILDITANTTTAGGTTKTVNPIQVGDCLFGDHFVPGTYVTALGQTDANGNPVAPPTGKTSWTTDGWITGRFMISQPHSNVTGVPPYVVRNPCSWDSAVNRFKISTGLNLHPGYLSTAPATVSRSIGYPTVASGTLAATLGLTAAAGAILQPVTNGYNNPPGSGYGGGGAVQIGTAGQFMDGVVKQTMNWATFMTSFEPDGTIAGVTQNTVKQAFASWVNGQQDNYMYVCWDNDPTPAASSSAPSSLGQILNINQTNGTCPIYSPKPAAGVANNGPTLAAFVMGTIAAIDFTRLNGRKTLAFRAQSGIIPDITSGLVAGFLENNFYNYYGIWTTANDLFEFMYPGFVSGPYKWVDSYVNQIWMNNGFQLAMMELLTQVGSIAYNQTGYTLIKAACQDVIDAAVLFGAIRTGVTLSDAQIAEVNNAAGVQIDGILNARGYYLQVLDATPQVREARGSPPMTFWYMDGGSVQRLSLASVMVQ
jgi:hypothetical protein